MAKTSEPVFYYMRDESGRPVTTVCLIGMDYVDGARYARGSATCGKKDLLHLRKDVGRRIAEQRAMGVVNEVPTDFGNVFGRPDMQLLSATELSPLERSLFSLDKPAKEPSDPASLNNALGFANQPANTRE